MNMENEIVSFGRRAGPDVSSVKASIFYISEVLNQNCMIRVGSVFTWLKVIDTVQVRNINPPAIRSWAVLIVLINVHTKNYYIDTVNSLKEEYAFCSNCKLFGISTILITFKHLQ